MITIRDTTLHRTGTVLGYDGRTAAVQWKAGQFVEVTKKELESGRYRLGKEV
jgi:hypothetical protein